MTEVVEVSNRNPTSVAKSVESDLPEGEAHQELSHLDLLESKSGDSMISANDLKTTVGAFNVRMQRRKKEKAEQADSQDSLAKVRQQLLLQSMVKIRRSLEEVVRIDLGSRFRLLLLKDDHHGWPRLTIRLVDGLRPNGEYPIFRIISHDRQARGAIEIEYMEGVAPEMLSLARDADYKRLPATLKKCVRDYLDHVGEIVLQAEHADDDDDHAIAEEALVPEFKERSSTGEPDFFDESYAFQDSFEKLPELDEVESLSLAPNDAE